MSSSLDVVKRLIVPLCLLALVVAAGFAMFSTEKSNEAHRALPAHRLAL